MTEAEPPATINEDDPLPPGIADDNFAARLREERERKHWTQADVAKFMAERGWPWHPQTVQKIENGHRKVTVGEAIALADIFKTTVDRLTWPSKVASAAGLLTMYTVRAERAAEQIEQWTGILIYSQKHLKANLSRVEADDYLGSEEIRRLASEAHDALGLRAGVAVAEAMRREDEAGDDLEEEQDEDPPPLLRAEGS